MTDFDTFRNEWMGERVSDPLLGAVGLPSSKWYQCVSLIKQYLRECFSIEAGFWGNAIDYWTHTNSALLDSFDRLQITDVRKGDIVVLNGLSGNSDGHIMIGTGNEDASMFEGIEQNGSTGGGTGTGGDAIRTRNVTKSRIAGILRPKVRTTIVIEAPSPIPAPPVSPPPTAPIPYPSTEPYTIVKQIPGYLSSNQAANHLGGSVPVPKGVYTIFNKRYTADGTLVAINVTMVPGKPDWWINPADNVANPSPITDFIGPRESSQPTPPPVVVSVPLTWKQTTIYKDAAGNDAPKHYVCVSHNPYMVEDLEGKASNKPVPLKLGWNIQIAGEFTKDSVIYGRPLAAMYNKQGQYIAKWYGVPLRHGDNTPISPPIIELYSDVYETELPFTEKRSLNIVHIGDYIQLAFEHIREFFSEIRGK